MDDATTADLADKFMGEDIDRILQVHVTRSSRPLSGPLSRPLSRPRPHLLFVDRMVQERSKEVEFTDGGGYDEEENGEDDTAATAAATAGASSSSSGAGGEVKRGRGRPRKSQFAQVPSLRTLPRLSPSPDPDPLPHLSPSLCPSPAQVTYVMPFATLQSDPSVRLDDADFWEKVGYSPSRPRAHALLPAFVPSPLHHSSRTPLSLLLLSPSPRSRRGLPGASRRCPSPTRAWAASRRSSRTTSRCVPI